MYVPEPAPTQLLYH